MNGKRGISVALTLALMYLVAPCLLCAGSLDKVVSLSEKCKSGKQSACDDLAKIALNERDENVRDAAVLRLTDKSLLAKIAANDAAAEVRSDAARGLTDQSLLAKIAVDDPDAKVRGVAVFRLTDQSLSAKIAVNDSDSTVRSFAMVCLNDQALLANIAVNTPDAIIRRSAVIHLTDKSLLAKIAVNDQDAKVRRNALLRLNDQALLIKIAAEDTDANVRSAAKSKLGYMCLDAAKRGDTTAIQTLLSLGIDVNLADGHGRTALMYASENGNLETVRFLLEKGADVNAIHQGLELGYVLMPNGAKAYPGPTTSASQIAAMTGGTIPREEGVTALTLATRNGHKEIMDLLIKAGAK